MVTTTNVTDSSQTEKIKGLFDKWIRILKMETWDILIHYISDPMSIDRNFNSLQTSLMNTTADWRYLHATINVNLIACAYESDQELEFDVLHELCHILVNEMREGDIAHEERVVTQISRAIAWAHEASRKEQEDGGER